tara:strand:+ start:1415 stop:4327 length:2913 start_codon:yes stop_codon:yes gene_type:complete
MAKGYQRHSRGGSFKRQDFGDLGLRSYKDQQQQIISSLKLQASRSKEYGQQYGSALKGVAANEQENKDILARLEDEAYRTRRDAIKKRSTTEVDALKGQADEAGKKADFWKDFSTTQAKQWSDLAAGTRKFADLRYGMAEYEKALADGSLEKQISFTQKMYNSIATKAFKAGSVPSDAGLTVALQLSTLDNSHAKSLLFWDHYKRNFESRKLALERESRKEMNGEMAIPLGVLDAHLFLKQFNINPKTPGGKKIIEYAKTQFGLLAQKAQDIKLARRSEESIPFQIRTFLSMVEDYEKNPDRYTFEDVSVVFNGIMRHFEHRYELNPTTGVVNKPPMDSNGISLGRNRGDVLNTVAEAFLKHAPADHAIHTDLNRYKEMLFKWHILPDKDGVPPKLKSGNYIVYESKFEKKIRDEIVPKWSAYEAQAEKGELAKIKSEKFLIPRQEFLAKVAAAGADNPESDNYYLKDWSEGGWVEQLRNAAWASGNNDFIKWMQEHIGFNPEKHVDWVIHRQWKEALFSGTEEGLREAINLFGKFDPKKVGNYSENIKGMETMRLLVATGLYHKPEHTGLADRLVDPHINPGNTAKISEVDTQNADETKRRINAYRVYIISTLSLDNFNGDSQKLIERAEEIVEEEFNKGLPRDGKPGTGLFRAVTGENTKGVYGTVWIGWDDNKVGVDQAGVQGTANTRSFSKMIEDMGNVTAKTFNSAIDRKIEEGYFITADESIEIGNSIIKGEWDFKIPENIVRLASLKGWGERDTLNYVLQKMGIDLSIPVGPRDVLEKRGLISIEEREQRQRIKKLNAEGIDHHSVDAEGEYLMEPWDRRYALMDAAINTKTWEPTTRYALNMLLWKKHILESGRFPNYGPRSPEFIEWKEQQEQLETAKELAKQNQIKSQQEFIRIQNKIKAGDIGDFKVIEDPGYSEFNPLQGLKTSSSGLPQYPFAENKYNEEKPEPGTLPDWYTLGDNI